MSHTSVAQNLACWLALVGALGCVEREAEPTANPHGFAANDGGSSMRNTPGRAASGTAGAVAEPSCAAPSGPYRGRYEALAGTCGSFSSDVGIPIDNNITIAKFAEMDVETETIVKNCTLFMKQVIRNKATGAVKTVLQGALLQLDPDGATARGVVSLQRFDPAGAATCSGDYDATLTKLDDVVAGAAASKP